MSVSRFFPAVLASASFGDDALLTHTFCQERLTKNVIDLVAASVVEIFALEKYSSTACMLTKSLSFSDDAWATCVGAMKLCEFGDKCWIFLRRVMCSL